jgi:hypothetical protein
LRSNEFVDVGISEHAARALLAVADGHIAQRAGGDVAVEGLHRAAELGSGLRGGLEPIRWGRAQLARDRGGLRGVQIRTGNRNETILARENFFALAEQRLRPVPLAPKYLKRALGARRQFLCYGGMGHVAPGMALHRSSLDPLFDSGGSGRFI